jgi:hypothetical protein
MGGFVLYHGAAKDPISQPMVQEFGIDDIRSVTAEQGGQFVLDVHDFPARRLARLEFHQNVYVAFRSEIIAKDRAEQRQTPDVVTLTKLEQPLT